MWKSSGSKAESNRCINIGSYEKQVEEGVIRIIDHVPGPTAGIYNVLLLELNCMSSEVH